MDEVYGFSNLNIVNKLTDLLAISEVPNPFFYEVSYYYKGNRDDCLRSNKFAKLITPIKIMPNLGLYEKYINE